MSFQRPAFKWMLSFLHYLFYLKKMAFFRREFQRKKEKSLTACRQVGNVCIFHLSNSESSKFREMGSVCLLPNKINSGNCNVGFIYCLWFRRVRQNCLLQRPGCFTHNPQSFTDSQKMRCKWIPKVRLDSWLTVQKGQKAVLVCDIHIECDRGEINWGGCGYF